MLHVQVPIGAWHGNGRKAGWYSPFLLACWDPEREEFQSVCRVMSGFSDVFYKAAKERYDREHLLADKLSYVYTSESPDVWFAPTEVWEIRGADLTLSPVHKAAVGKLHPTRGCSLRFPRFIKVLPLCPCCPVCQGNALWSMLPHRPYRRCTRNQTCATVVVYIHTKGAQAASCSRSDCPILLGSLMPATSRECWFRGRCLAACCGSGQAVTFQRASSGCDGQNGSSSRVSADSRG